MNDWPISCPLCGIESQCFEEYNLFFVECNDCGCRSGNADSEKEAIEWWNVRPKNDPS